MDIRVDAIRNDPCVGRGSCTSIDECFEDKELIENLDTSGVTSKKDAVKWARDHEGLWLEKGLNQRWGSDDDPQLKMWNDWKTNIKNNPI
jgi:hypothetical protein|tara:strand:+ start:6502 stop:6771 length:270 start_codon:yes stop_codon:yes gene_type:complete